MSKIPSASTTTITAYFTNYGREIFLSLDPNKQRFSYNVNGDLIDKFEVVNFSLYDTDVNYKSLNQLESGDVPSLSGNKNKLINDNLTKRNETKNRIIK